MPALLTRTSTTPCSAVTEETKVAMEASEVMSSSWKLRVPWGLRAWISERALVPFAEERAVRMTWLEGEALARM